MLTNVTTLLGCIEIWIEHAHFGDAIDRQAVAPGGAPHRLGHGRLVDAKRLLPVWRHIGVDPSNTLQRIVLDECQAGLLSLVWAGQNEPFMESPFNEVARHIMFLLYPINKIH
jgi:hypothetical protein